MTGTGGFFIIAPIKIIINGAISNQFQLNIASNSDNIAIAVFDSACPEISKLLPVIKNTIKVITAAGNVVQVIDFIWSYKPTPAVAEAKFVVSESGDILSPKIAPLMVAAAVMCNGTPTPAEILIIATPTVPTDPHEVPVTKENIALIPKADISICSGLTI